MTTRKYYYCCCFATFLFTCLLQLSFLLSVVDGFQDRKSLPGGGSSSLRAGAGSRRTVAGEGLDQGFTTSRTTPQAMAALASEKPLASGSGGGLSSWTKKRAQGEPEGIEMSYVPPSRRGQGGGEDEGGRDGTGWDGWDTSQAPHRPLQKKNISTTPPAGYFFF